MAQMSKIVQVTRYLHVLRFYYSSTTQVSDNLNKPNGWGKINSHKYEGVKLEIVHIVNGIPHHQGLLSQFVVISDHLNVLGW